MENITRKVRIYFGAAFGGLAEALNPEADELDDETRLEIVDDAIRDFVEGAQAYLADPDLPHSVSAKP